MKLSVCEQQLHISIQEPTDCDHVLEDLHLSRKSRYLLYQERRILCNGQVVARSIPLGREDLFLCMKRLFLQDVSKRPLAMRQQQFKIKPRIQTEKKSCRSLQQRAGTPFSHLCFSFTVYIQSSGGKCHDDSDQHRKRLHPITPLSVYILSCFL